MDNQAQIIADMASKIAELEGQMADKSKLSLPAEELKELIYSIHGSHHVGDAQHAKLDIINAQIDSLYANREPFVVTMPCVVEIKDTKYPYDQPATYYLADKITEAITAAGGRCV